MTNALARYVPSDLSECLKVSEFLSRGHLLPSIMVGKPHNVLIVVLTGAELGLSPMQSIREISVVNGRGYISSLLKVALVKQSPLCEDWRLVESTAQKATFSAKRKGEAHPVVLSFTIEEAKAAGLAGGDNWKKYPALMLRRRCQGQLADEVFPDVVRGIKTLDERAEIEVGSAYTEEKPRSPELAIDDMIVVSVADPILEQLALASSRDEIDQLGVQASKLPLTDEDKVRLTEAFATRRAAL